MPMPESLAVGAGEPSLLSCAKGVTNTSVDEILCISWRTAIVWLPGSKEKILLTAVGPSPA